MRSWLLVPVMAFAAAPVSGICQEPSKDVGGEKSLKVVKYEEFEAAVRAARGKVVVVYLWANYDVIAKKHFPKVVKFHEMHAKAGLVVMSLSVDPKPLQEQDRIAKYLKSIKATFRNMILDEPIEVWQSKLRTYEPDLLIFDKTGKRVPFDLLKDDWRFEAAERQLFKLLMK